MSSTRKAAVAIAASFAVLVLLAAIGLAWFFRDDAPAAVSIDAAVSAAPSTTTAGNGIAGTWTVDADSGSFDFESATGTFAGFRVAEELRSIGSTTAVGRTGDVTGELVIDGTSVTDASFTADLRSVTTNESRRDDKVQSALDTGEFPTATFVLTAPIELPGGADSGATVRTRAAGRLTIHGVTKAVELPIEAKLVGDTIVLVGSTEITFSDYGVRVPTSPTVLSVDDHGVLEVQLLLVRR
jgi:polyisoprenoid-binding protein YceI